MRYEVRKGKALEYLTLFPEGYEEATSYPLIVWLHGFGADMRDLASLARTVARSGYLHVLPNAPLGGFGGPEGTVRAWFERGGKERPESVRLALDGIASIFAEILTGYKVPPGEAALVGFSQGGNLALRAGLPRPDLFRAVAALSCSLRQAEALNAGLPSARDQALFLAHGVDDDMVAVGCSRDVVAFMQEKGYHPLYQEYPIGHEISMELAQALSHWITRVLPPRTA